MENQDSGNENSAQSQAIAETEMSLKKRQRLRKLKFLWTSEQASALIAAVQKCPPLWDGGCSEYRLTNVKSDCWQQVARELAIPQVDANEAKIKWNILRSLFKTNLGKMRCKKSGQAASDVIKVTWAHFPELMFLESAEVSQSSMSTSTMELEGAYTDASFLRDLSEQSTSRVPSAVDIPTAPRRKKSKTPTPASTPTSSPSVSQAGSMKDLAAEVLSNLSSRSTDRFQSCADLIAGHLRSLPPSEALQLETILMTNMYNFLGSRGNVSLETGVMVEDEEDMQLDTTLQDDEEHIICCCDVDINVEEED